MKYCSIFLISSVLLFIGCMPMINNFETAQTAPHKEIQFGGSLAPYYFSISQEDGFSNVFWPTTRLTAKYGITKNFDVGVGTLFAYWIPGVIVNTKYQFLSGNLDGSFFLDGSYYGFDIDLFNERIKYKISNIKPTLIFSREKAHQFPFSLAIGMHYWLVGAHSETEQVSSSITSFITNIGFPIRFGASRSLKIMPEIGLWLPITGSVSIEGEDSTYAFEGGNFIGQFGVYFGK